MLFVSLLAGWIIVATGRADSPPVPKLVVTVATWGDVPDGKTLDVTKKVAALVKHDSLNVKADRPTLGDPMSGAANKLKVGYTLDGVYKSKTVNDGEVLDISTRLLITKATYGDLPSGKQADVTDVVADLVQSNALKLEVGNDLFGDPAPNTPKQLKVEYTFDGVAGSVSAPEGQTLKAPTK